MGIHPTIMTDCAHLVTPWVALYQYSHFGGRELCFEGKGLINLADFGFDKQTEAINIAANGAVRRCALYPLVGNVQHHESECD
jgi:hypothetical protein